MLCTMVLVCWLSASILSMKLLMPTSQFSVAVGCTARASQPVEDVEGKKSGCGVGREISLIQKLAIVGNFAARLTGQDC